MNKLSNKIDFAVVICVRNANPNGDPLSGNRPRITSDGFGEISDVCLKRKLRNRLQAAGKEIFVQSDENAVDGKRSLSDRFGDYLSTLPADKRKDKISVYQEVCKQWFDVRAFGQVFAFKAQKNKGIDEVSLGVRGPVTIQSAFTVEPISIESIQITKSVNSETTESGQKSSDTMGMKHRVGSAVYVTYGSISPQLAERTGFSDDDAKAVKNALVSLFDGDESSARPGGSMQVKKVIWWRHNDKSGQYSSAKVHDSLSVDNKGNVTVGNLDGLSAEIIDG